MWIEIQSISMKHYYPYKTRFRLTDVHVRKREKERERGGERKKYSAFFYFHQKTTAYANWSEIHIAFFRYNLKWRQQQQQQQQNDYIKSYQNWTKFIWLKITLNLHWKFLLNDSTNTHYGHWCDSSCCMNTIYTIIVPHNT